MPGRNVLLLIAVPYAAGIVLAEYSGEPWLPLPWMALSVILLAACFGFRTIRLRLVGLVLAAAAAGATNWITHRAALTDPNMKHLPTYSEIFAVGKIAGPVTRQDSKQKFKLQLSSFGNEGRWFAARGYILVYAPDKPELQWHDQVFMRGILIWPVREKNPGGPAPQRKYAIQGIQARLVVKKSHQLIKLGEAKPHILDFRYHAYRLQQMITHRIDEIFSRDAAFLVKGLLIGARDEIDNHIFRHFSRSGVIHVLAVSGLHVGFILLIVWAVAALLRLPRNWIYPLLIAATWLYAFMTGLGEPVVRAATMASLVIVALMLDRPLSPPNFLAAAALFILWIRPGAVFKPGFQLSFSAVAGIFYLYPKWQKAVSGFSILQKWRPIKWGVSLFLVSVAAQLGSLPFSLYHFGVLPYAGLLINLIVIPAVFLIVATSFLALLPLEWASKSFVTLAESTLKLLLELTQWLSTQAAAYVEHWHPSLRFLLLAAVAIILIVEFKKVKWRYSLLLVLLGILNATVWWDIFFRPPALQVTFLDVGQGDAAMVRMPSGRTLLVDAGPAPPVPSPFLPPVVQYCVRNQIRTVEMVVISHPHLDHYGGLEHLLEVVKIKKIVVADTGNQHPKRYKAMLNRAQSRGAAIHIAKRGDILNDFYPVQLWVLGPAPEHVHSPKDWNRASLILQVRYGKQAILFMGDAERTAEKHILGFKDILGASLLKVGHHGSATSSTPSFLMAVQPHFAVLSLGVLNKFNHPSPLVVQRLKQIGAVPVRTDLNGAVIYRSNGITIDRVK